MSLRIVPASAAIKVETLILTLYAPPGTGKTSLGFSVDAPLLLDADKGAYRSAFRKDSAPASSWEDFANITADDVKPYKTLVLDTAGRALDLLSADIIRQNPKMGRGGALTLQGYGELKSRFAQFLTLIRSFGLDIVLIAHSDEKQSGDELIERIDMQGGSKQEVYKSSDAMARLTIRDGKRILTFSPTDTQFGKDPAALGAIEVPHLADEPQFLGSVIQRIKDKLNELTADAKAAQERAAAWADDCRAADSVDKLNALRPRALTVDQKRVLLNIANHAGFTFDKEGDTFVAPVAQKPADSTDGEQAETGAKGEDEPKPAKGKKAARTETRELEGMPA